MISASGPSLVAVVDVERDHAEAGLGEDPVEHEAGGVGELDLDDGLLDARLFGEAGDRLVEPVDERLVRPFDDGCPQLGHVSEGSAQPS